MTAQQAFEARFEDKLHRFEDKLHALMPYLVKTARGDEDLIQEGAIGIWQSMKEQPYAATKFHATKAKWSIINVARGVGKSVDIPKQYPRKFPITLVHCDAIPDNADADLAQAILADRNSLPLDEMVIRKMDYERFINTLTTTEERYIQYKVVDELPDRVVADALSMSVEKLQAMKSTLRGKIKDHFTD
jgi:DNA-directed RNA polymerase specialized sigma24 family protein